MRGLILFAVLALAACASANDQGWTGSNATPFDSAVARCQIETQTVEGDAFEACMAALGWTAVAIPEAHGGVGLSLAEVVPLVEQMGRHLLASPLISSALAAQALVAGGIEAQQATIARVVAETATQIEAQQATIARVRAETATQIEAQIGAIAEAQAGLINSQAEDKRYAALARQGGHWLSRGFVPR